MQVYLMFTSKKISNSVGHVFWPLIPCWMLENRSLFHVEYLTRLPTCFSSPQRFFMRNKNIIPCLTFLHIFYESLMMFCLHIGWVHCTTVNIFTRKLIRRYRPNLSSEWAVV